MDALVLIPALPDRYRLLGELAAGPGMRGFKVVDERLGLACRLVLASAPGEPVLALHRDHHERASLAAAHGARALTLEQAPDGTWFRTEAWVEPLTPAPVALVPALAGWLGGLAALHAAGRVHGGLCLAELGYDADGLAVLASPGRGGRVGQAAVPLAVGDAARATQAPEQWAHGRVDGRTDLYMLGALLLGWLSDGRLAAPRDSEGLARALDELAATQEAWLDLVGGLLAPAPEDRFASAGEALAALPGLQGQLLPAPAGHVTPFVGRRSELVGLLAALDGAVDTLSPRAVMLTGTAGVGKSRLLEELRRRARQRGCAVVSTSAAEGGSAPYAGVQTLVEALWELAPTAARKALAPALRAMLPGVGGELPGLEPRAARTRLFAAIADLLEATATPPGLLVCVDDWHTADAASRELLDFLGRALPPLPLCLVLAGRGMQDEPPVSPWPGGHGLALGGLGRREAGALCRGVLAGGSSAGSEGALRASGSEVATALDERCGGNPALLEAGAIACRAALADGGMRAATLVARMASADTLESFWRSRLAEAPAPARRLAAAAAVAGPRSSLGCLQTVAALEAEALPAALDALGALGVLVREGEGYTLVAPVEPVLALAADEVTSAELHGRALGWCQLAAQLGGALAPARLANHALASGRDLESAHYALAAARRALELFALADAEHFLTRGAASLGRVDGTPVAAALRVDYVVARGDVERYLARGAEAERCYRAALASSALAGDRRADVLTSLGIALNLASRGTEAEALFREAAADAGAPGAARARAVAALARLHVRMGRLPEAVRACCEALAIAGATLAVQGEALGLMGLACVNQGEVKEGLVHLERAQELARRTGDRLALANACMLAGNARFGLGQLEPARDEFSRYALLCQELGLPDEALCASLNLAQVSLAQGRYVEAWQRARSGAEAAAAAGNKVYEAFGLAHVALAGAQLGYLTEAEAASRKAAEVAAPLGEAVALQVGAMRVELAVFLGRFGQAEELALPLTERAEGAEAGTLALSLAQVYLMSGDVAPAVEQLRQARGHAVALGDAVLQAAVELAFGQVALGSGQVGLAHARGLEALELATEAGAGLVRLRAHLLVAQTGWQLGRPAETDTHLKAAQALAESLSSPHWQAITWQAQSRLRTDGVALRLKAATYIQFYMQQLAPRARQEFLNWPERRDALNGRGTTPLEARVPAVSRYPAVHEAWEGTP